MQVNNENYYSKEVRSKFLSATSIKEIIGTANSDKSGCPAAAKAKQNGWKSQFEKDNKALLIGSYVDAYFECTLEQYKGTNPEIYNSKTGELKVDYQHADIIIRYIERDSFFMQFMKGEKQKIYQTELFGLPIIAKLDFEQSDKIIDLKVMATMNPEYIKGLGYVPFIEYWGYDLQLGVYQKIIENITGIKKDSYIAVVTKQKPPRKAIVKIPQEKLDDEIKWIAYNLHTLEYYLTDNPQPHCGKCDYCLETQNISKETDYSELSFKN
jgi:hypothetical protein